MEVLISSSHTPKIATGTLGSAHAPLETASLELAFDEAEDPFITLLEE